MRSLVKSMMSVLVVFLGLSMNGSDAQKTSVSASPVIQTVTEEAELAIESRNREIFAAAPSVDLKEDPKRAAFKILLATARNGCGPPEQAQYMVDLGQKNLGQYNDELFALPPLVRYLYMYPQCLTDSQRQTLKQELTSKPKHLFDHGTMNHMVMQATSWYLLAQFFPDAQWVDVSGAKLTSSQVMAQLKDLLTRRHWRSFQSGMSEMLSSTYAMVDFYPLLNLVDFAEDKRVAQQASDEANLEVLILKADAFHGVLMPPLTRHNVDQSNAPWPRWPLSFGGLAQQLLWYYFGKPRFDVHGLSNFLERGNEAIFILTLSPWRPAPAAWSMPASNYSLRIRTPEFTKWDDPTFPMAYGDTWFGRDYALAAGNFVFDPRHYADHNQSFALAFTSDFRRNFLECQHPYWKSNEGENAWSTDFWSPFLQTWRLDDNHAVLLAAIPQRDPWTKEWSNDIEDRFWMERDKHKDALFQLVQCRIPKAVDQFVLEDQWIFFRKGGVSVALHSLAGTFERAGEGLPSLVANDFIVLKIHQERTALFVMVDEKGGSFEDFQNRAKASVLKYSPDGPSVAFNDTIVRFMPPAPDPIHQGYWRALPEVVVHGATRPYQDTPVIDSSFLTLDRGVLQVKGKQSLTIRGPERPIGERPATFQ